MKLSIVIPAYNEERYIGACLEAIESMIPGHEQDIEVIVVNNASTDGTRAVAERYPFARIVDESAKGLVRARRAGYLASSGELVANIDADTRMPIGWIDTVLAEFDRHTRLVALSGPYYYYDVSTFVHASTWFWYRVGYVSHWVNQYVLRRGAMLQGGNFIVRRSALEAIGGYNLEFDFWGEDTDIARRMCVVGEVKFSFALTMPTSGRRINQEGMLTTAGRYAINYVWALLFDKPFTHDVKDIRE